MLGGVVVVISNYLVDYLGITDPVQVSGIVPKDPWRKNIFL
jgi:hypothetical protein